MNLKGAGESCGMPLSGKRRARTAMRPGVKAIRRLPRRTPNHQAGALQGQAGTAQAGIEALP